MKLSKVVSALLVTSSIVFVGCGSSSNSNKKGQSKTSAILQTPKVGDVKAMNNLNFPLGTATFSNGFELNATWGIGSAAAHKAGDDNNTFYAMTDRGVNIKCKDDEKIIGINICESGKIFPFPAFTPTIVKFEINGENVIVKEVITLKDKDANLMTGVSNPLSNFSEKAYNIDGSELAYDTNGLDAEALAVMNDGSFWIAEEYAPSLVHVNAAGKVIERLIPNGVTGLESANYVVKDVLPAIIAKRHENRGIESIAISPDEKSLYFSLQSPLDNPDYKKTANVRLYKLNLNDYSDIKEYLYVEDKPETFNKDNETKERVQKDVKVSEMTALDNDILMVLERISATTKLFKVDLTTAVEVPVTSHDNLETNATGVTPVSKVKVFDTDLEIGYPKKVEGIANLGGGRFLLINDDDFGIEGDSTVAKVATIDLNATLDSKQTMGKVIFFDTNGTYQKTVKVGILPDMVTFTHDGKKVLVANEGELAGNENLDAPLYDPYGSVSIIDTATYNVDTVDFKSVTTAPTGSKIRKGAEIARDFEPEYIAVSEDDKVAWVSLQESNAVARINLETNTLDKVFGLGFKDLSLAESAMDSKKDGVVDIAALPAGVYGMYQPDTIATYKVAGVNYIVTANEGDDRDDFYKETVKASKLTHTAIGDIGDLRVNPDIGDEDGDGDYEKLYAYGARSFSIFNGDTGLLVYDSKNEMATTVANQIDHAYFNTRSKKGNWRGTDERSEKKGVEPEALALYTKNGKTFAYVGLEKQGGFFVYDITDPANAQMVEYSNDINYSVKDFDVLPNLATLDDMNPEGSVTFTQSAKDYYAVANEVSGTVSIYELAPDGKVLKQGTYRTGIYGKSATEIVEYDAVGKKLFVTSAAKNAVLILDISDVTNPTLLKEIDLSVYGTGVNSVSVFSDKIAIAVEVKE